MHHTILDLQWVVDEEGMWFSVMKFQKYMRNHVTQTLEGNEKQFELAGVRVIGTDWIFNLPCWQLIVTDFLALQCIEHLLIPSKTVTWLCIFMIFKHNLLVAPILLKSNCCRVSFSVLTDYTTRWANAVASKSSQKNQNLSYQPGEILVKF